MDSSMEERASQYNREMSGFIVEEVDEGVTPPSKSEPGKLARLSATQFKELGTDVYDELIRRRIPDQGLPFLPVRDHYHPKRNQARQKLATLSRPKFVDLVHDVNEELKRRFPHKIDTTHGHGAMSHGSSYESLNISPVYSNHGGQQNYNQQHSYSQQQSYGQQQKYGQQQNYGQQSERSPPVSTGNHSHTPSIDNGYNMQRKISKGSSFGNLDQAANDFGHQPSNQNSRVPSGDGRALYSPTGEIEKLKNEYEMRLNAMRKRVGQLESQMLDYRGDNPGNNADEQVANLERLNNVLAQKNERQENDMRILRDQLVTAKADIPALRQENDRLKQERAQFIERERDLKSKLDEARASIRKLKTTSVFAMDHGEADIVPSPAFANTGGVIRPSSVRAFQDSIEILLSAVRSEDAESELPAAQGAVAAACAGLRADVDGYEIAHSQDPGSWPLADDAKDQLPSIIHNLNVNLHKLAEAVNKHLGSMGVLPVSLLEAAASHLATSVVDLVKLLKVCFDESKAAPRPQAGSQRSLEESTDNIVAGIQSMLQLVRAPVPEPHGLYSSLQAVIGSIRTTISICRDEFEKVESAAGADPGAQININVYDPRSARNVLGGLEKGNLQLTDQLNDINEAHDAAGDSDIDNEIVRELLSEMVFKQGLTSALIDVLKLTKTLVVWLE
ncbi:component of the polarisome [Coemansia erecta]|nr:component of the polarisome [Coemansia sp. RSA 2618]KAJ2826476.1 component of the polarisome [Coemansia erecta]